MVGEERMCRWPAQAVGSLHALSWPRCGRSNVYWEENSRLLGRTSLDGIEADIYRMHRPGRSMACYAAIGCGCSMVLKQLSMPHEEMELSGSLSLCGVT